MKVYKAINAVQSALSRTGISKDRSNQQQGYKFRGIDDVYNAVSPLLAEHGLCILPRVLSRECVERATKNGSAIFYITVEAEFDFVCAEDGSKHTVKTFGEAMDSGDKATNKAMSAAYKYAAFQAFAIPTEGDNDADAHSPEVRALEAEWAKKQSELDELALTMIDLHREGQDMKAIKLWYAPGTFSPENHKETAEKEYLWGLLKTESKLRSAIKANHPDRLAAGTQAA